MTPDLTAKRLAEIEREGNDTVVEARAMASELRRARSDKARLDWLEQCWVRVQHGSGLKATFLDASPPKWPYHDEPGRDWLITKGPHISLRDQVDAARQGDHP